MSVPALSLNAGNRFTRRGQLAASGPELRIALFDVESSSEGAWRRNRKKYYEPRSFSEGRQELSIDEFVKTKTNPNTGIKNTSKSDPVIDISRVV